ncbi:hypothetical protein GXW78_27140 [Roseomonas terrae]|uniref:Zinc ribbon domain-containing protein n=1 Tax=Neoroseomonas terrae TaxID=424799 RepID=A0ABS5EQS7_9PROT|nr:zinc ribbon domain-containing protein [Neoroseomonas terrae]MBR0653356.1 hypothetical protein [Neoroseomonas terrae]
MIFLPADGPAWAKTAEVGRHQTAGKPSSEIAMTDSVELKCTDCGTVLEVGVAAGAVVSTDPCPHCGSTQQTVHLTFYDQVLIKVRDRMEMKVKNDSFPRRKKVRKESIQGFDVRVSKGDYVYKEREIDRDNNTYREHVTEETGAVIHSVSEKLSDHFGHGSAKFKKKPPGSGEGV